MPEEAGRFNGTPVTHDGAGFRADDIGDETQHLRRHTHRGTRRRDRQHRVAGADPIHYADGKGRHVEETVLVVVDQDTGRAARDQKIRGRNSPGDILGHWSQIAAYLAGVQADFRFAQRNVIGAGIF